MALADSFAEFEVSTRHQLAALEHHVTSRLSEMSAQIARDLARAERGVSERFNQTARRLRLAETPGEWRTILTETARAFAGRAEVFLVSELPASGAPAFAAVIESKETVVTLRDASQLSAGIAEQLGPALSARCYLVPILHHGEAVAVLYAESTTPMDRNAMELVAALAQDSLPAVPAAEVEPEPEPEPAPAPPALIQISGLQPPKPQPAPVVVEIPATDWPLHLAARRYAKVAVARILLTAHSMVRTGRQNSQLYVLLKERIDSGREAFQQQFLEPCPSMADYFHEELVRTLAHDDAAQMGSEYPGRLR